MELDEKQCIANEMIACTFFLGLVKDGNDSNTTLFSLLYRKQWEENNQKK
jgi:hypothetical protein